LLAFIERLQVVAAEASNFEQVLRHPGMGEQDVVEDLKMNKGREVLTAVEEFHSLFCWE
jgi:hypothetical protein